MTTFKAKSNPILGGFSYDVLIVRIVQFRSLLFYCSKCSYCSEVYRA